MIKGMTPRKQVRKNVHPEKGSLRGKAQETQNLGSRDKSRDFSTHFPRDPGLARHPSSLQPDLFKAESD